MIEPTSAKSTVVRRPTCRRCNLGDLMILVVAVAVGVAWLKMTSVYVPFFTRQPVHIAIPALLVFYVPAPLTTISIAALIVRLRPPRPRLRRLFRQPGASAVAVMCATTIFSACSFTLGHLTVLNRWVSAPQMSVRVQIVGSPTAVVFDTNNAFVEPLILYLSDLLTSCVPAVWGGWFVLACSGGLRREPGWIDLLGTLIGVVWIILWLAKVWLLLF